MASYGNLYLIFLFVGRFLIIRSKESQGVPYSVLLYETFRGNEQGLQNALSRGDVREPFFLIGMHRKWCYLYSLPKPKVTLISLPITAIT
jgi:hypothetical protein